MARERSPAPPFLCDHDPALRRIVQYSEGGSMYDAPWLKLYVVCLVCGKKAVV